MDGHRFQAGGDLGTGGACPEWCEACTRALAQVIRRCLLELVSGCEPPPEVWERILTRLRSASPGVC